MALFDGVCVQSIEHPGCAWDVKFLENGDLVTACSDGVVRIWTTHEDSWRLEAGGVVGLDSLQVPGTSDGQTKVVREGDNGVAYTLSMKDYKWDKIGEVADGPGDGLKCPVLDGKEYDHVFDVDIGHGEPIRKLPYNRSSITVFTKQVTFLMVYLASSFINLFL
ncbi:Ubiquitin homeostasis protein lub1 [Bienertia sinuspersici]